MCLCVCVYMREKSILSINYRCCKPQQHKIFKIFIQIAKEKDASVPINRYLSLRDDYVLVSDDDKL